MAGLSSLKNEVLARVDCVELPSSCCALTQLTRWHDDAAELYKTGVQSSNRLLLLRGCESSGFSTSDELVVDPIHQDRFSASLSKASGSGKPTTIHQPSTIKTLMQLVANWDELQCSSGPSGTIGTGKSIASSTTGYRQCCGGNCQAECSDVRKVFLEISDCVTACYAV